MMKSVLQEDSSDLTEISLAGTATAHMVETDRKHATRAPSESSRRNIPDNSRLEREITVKMALKKAGPP